MSLVVKISSTGLIAVL